jgi:hypothetical protein
MNGSFGLFPCAILLIDEQYIHMFWFTCGGTDSGFEIRAWHLLVRQSGL